MKKFYNCKKISEKLLKVLKNSTKRMNRQNHNFLPMSNTSSFDCISYAAWPFESSIAILFSFSSGVSKLDRSLFFVVLIVFLLSITTP